MFKPVRDGAKLSARFARAGASLQRVQALFDAEPEITDVPDAVAVGDYAFQAIQTVPTVEVSPVVEAPILWDMAVGDPPLTIGAAAGDGDYLRHGQTVSITRTAASLRPRMRAVSA